VAGPQPPGIGRGPQGSNQDELVRIYTIYASAVENPSPRCRMVSVMTGRRPLAALGVAVALPLGGLLLVGPPLRSGASPALRSGTEPALRSGTESAGASPAIAAGTVTARITLASSRFPARSTVKGHLVLTNSGDRPVDLNHGCTPKWEVVLGKGTQPPDVAFTLDCGVAKFVVKPGATRRRFELQVGRRKPGKYRAFLVASDPSFPTAPPVRVTVVSAK
jgi:hypothetical protein